MSTEQARAPPQPHVGGLSIVLVAGRITQTPEPRVTVNGQNCAASVLLVRTDEGRNVFWRVLALAPPVRDDLLRLSVGDTITASGTLHSRGYEQGGRRRLALEFFATEIMPFVGRPAKQRGAR